MTATTPTTLTLTKLHNMLNNCLEAETYFIFVNGERVEDIECSWDEQDVTEICLLTSSNECRFDTITRVHENAIEVNHADVSGDEIVFFPANSEALIADVMAKCGTDPK